MKKIFRTIVVGMGLLVIAGCGASSGTSDTTSAATTDERTITGTLSTDVQASLAKAATATDSCVGEVCGIVAVDDSGAQVAGEIVPEENRWRVRVHAGNWMFGFLDGSGNRLGSMALNGITAFAIDAGDELDVGMLVMLGELFSSAEDIAGLIEHGMRPFHGRDMDHDGRPHGFDEDEPLFDPSIFAVIDLKPFDGQPYVAPCRPLKIEFSQAVDQTTLTAETIQVKLASDGSVVAGTFQYEEDVEDGEYEVKFLPTDGWAQGAIINVLIVSGDVGVKSASGLTLAMDIETNFGVRDLQGATMTCHDLEEEEHLMEQAREQEQEQDRLEEGEGPGNDDSEA